MTTQILNFGLSAPIDVGRDAVRNYDVAQKLLTRIRHVPGVVDAHIHQQVDHPKFNVTVDRAKAQQFGLTQRDIAQNVLISLSGSYQTAPNQWVNPASGVNYQVTVQTPQALIDSMDAMQSTPIMASAGGARDTQLLSNVANVERSSAPDIVSHYNIQPVYDIFCDTGLRDLGAVARDIQNILDNETKSGRLPQGSSLVMRGQVETLRGIAGAAGNSWEDRHFAYRNRRPVAGRRACPANRYDCGPRSRAFSVFSGADHSGAGEPGRSGSGGYPDKER